MKDSKKIRNNLIAGMAGQIVAVVLGIVVSRFVLLHYGSEVNGLLSSVTNIYAYIAIVEAGVAAASCQGLYKALTKNDLHQTNSILSATNRYYHRTGLIYLALIGAFSAIYPLLIDSEIPYHTIVLVILFNGFGNVVNYFFHGKFMILLKADGKNYVRAGLETLVNVVKQLLKILLIKLGYDVIFVQMVAMLASFLQMIYITCYIKKHYSWIDLSCEPDMAVISQSKHVLIHEINYLISTNVDVVLLTIFSTLKTVSVYSLYNMLYGTINKVLYTVREALEFKIAREFHSDQLGFQTVFHTFEVYYMAFAFSLFSITTYFVTPFLRLYTQGVTDTEYILPHLPILFALINLLASGRHPLDVMIQVSGHFRMTQKSAILESTINIIASLIFIQLWGITGVLLGSVASTLYRLVYMIYYVNSCILDRKVIVSYRCWLINFLVFLIVLLLNRLIVVALDSYVKIFAFCIPYAIGNILLFFGSASVLEPEAFRYAHSIVKLVLRKGNNNEFG